MNDDTVYVVSGFMRTGTSMMMKALEAGGMEAVQRKSRDQMRENYADENYDPNEGGLYELEANDFSEIGFPEKFKGRLIKVLMCANALAVMPKIKVVFMRRDPEEIRQSYQGFFGTPLPIKDTETLDQRITQNVALLRNRKDTDLLVFNYSDVIAHPYEHFKQLQENGWPIDPALAATVVDPTLYRFRREQLVEGIV